MEYTKRPSCIVCLIMTTTCWVVDRCRPRLAPLGLTLVHLWTFLPLSRRRFYPSGYDVRVGELRVDPGANWPHNFPLPHLRQKDWKMDKDGGRSCQKRYTKRPTALVCWCQTVCCYRNANQNSVGWFLENQLICWPPTKAGRKSPHTLKIDT